MWGSAKSVVIYLLFFIAFLSIPLLGIHIIYGSDLQFDVAEFSKQYLQFLFAILSTTFGFILANIWWVNREKTDKLNKEQQTLLSFIKMIDVLALQGITLLTQNSSEIRGEESHVDTRLHQIFQAMAFAQQGILLHYSDEVIEFDQKVSKAWIDHYWKEIVPSIESLMRFSRIRGNTEPILKELRMIRSSSKTLTSTLSN